MGLTTSVLQGVLRDVLLGSTSLSPIVVTTNTLAANRCQIATGSISITANFTSRRGHWAHPDGDISNLQTVDVGYYMGASTISNTSARTMKRYLEYPEGVFHQVTWAGSPTVTVQPGTRVKSDPVPGLTIPKGAKFWERTVNLNATVADHPIILLPTTSVTLGVDDGNAVGDLGNSGTIPPSTTNRTFGAAAIYGTVAAANARGFVIVGDSLVWGESDTTGIGPKGGTGWLARMLDIHGYPYLKIAVGGQQAMNFVGMTAAFNALLGEFGWTDFVLEYGINDLRLNRTKNQILADHQTIYGMANVINKRIWQTTITPRSDSTDGWATLANQTPKTDGMMADLTPLNTAIRALPANVYGVIEAADAAMSARDSNIHKAPPSGSPDGTHFNTIRCDLIANAVAAQIAI